MSTPAAPRSLAARLALPALILGGLACLYLFGAGVIGVLELPIYESLFVTPDPLQPDTLPFEQPMVNVIFGLGALFVFAASARTRRRKTVGGEWLTRTFTSTCSSDG